jgi:hypothetical protein
MGFRSHAARRRHRLDPAHPLLGRRMAGEKRCQIRATQRIDDEEMGDGRVALRIGMLACSAYAAILRNDLASHSGLPLISVRSGRRPIRSREIAICTSIVAIRRQHGHEECAKAGEQQAGAEKVGYDRRGRSHPAGERARRDQATAPSSETARRVRRVASA